MAQSGTLTWNIGGKDIQIANTYFLTLPEGLQYTVEYEVPNGVDLTSIADQQAYDLAFPLMKYAFEHHLHESTKVNAVSSGVVPVSRIGVSLFVRVGNGTRGYRVARNLEEVRARILSGR
jgi:hypothetical protein